MLILGINGSQRKESNSELLLDYALKRLGERFSVEKVNLSDVEIVCRGCESCFADFQFHNDGLAAVHEKILKADAILLSSPTYFGMPSNLTKLFMDRTNSIWLERGLKGKLGAVIVNGASRFGAIEMNAKNITHFFHDHEMVNAPFYACFNNSIAYPHEKFPNPLTEEFTSALDKLVQAVTDVRRLREGS